MSKYRKELPQLSGDLFLTDAGIETDLIFNHGIEIREFASHTLLPDPNGREALAKYFREFLSLANKLGRGHRSCSGGTIGGLARCHFFHR